MASKAESNITIQAWIESLSDDFLMAWANRGLFRRGTKLAETAKDALIEAAPDSLTSTLDTHTQKITGPGFKFITCSCPAAGICYHMLALLILLRNRYKQPDQPRTESVAPSGPSANSNEERGKDGQTNQPWLCDDPGELEKILGKANCQKAQKMMLQATPVVLSERDTELLATISEHDLFEVRIPAIGGLRASLCSCKKDRCAHRALAVLAASRQKKLLQANDLPSATLSSQQNQVLDQIKSWLHTLLILGVGGFSKAHVEQGKTLITQAKQADFPKISKQLTGITHWLDNELQRSSKTKPESLRFSLARIHAHLTAISSRPMPQPLLSLAGTHQRRYHIIKNLQLIGIGAEAWEIEKELCGFSLFLYAPEQKNWYRHTQARPISYSPGDSSSWEPLKEFNHMNWAMGPAYHAIPGHQIEMIHGWASADFQLSAWDGTRMQVTHVLKDDEELPITKDFSHLAHEYTNFITRSLFLDNPFMPVIIETNHLGEIFYDPYRQIWTRAVHDMNSRLVRLRLPMDNYGKKIAHELEKMKSSPKDGCWFFGMASSMNGEMTLRPISFSLKKPNVWQHLSMKT